MLKIIRILTLAKKVIINILNFKLLIMLEYQNTNIFLQKYIDNSNWSEEDFVIAKSKNTVPLAYVINDLNGKEIAGSFYEKELQKTNKKESRIERIIKRKGDKLYVKWKGYDNSSSSWIDTKKMLYRISQYLKQSI